MRNIVLLGATILLLACNKQPESVTETIRKSGRNRNELNKVIEHYKNEGDKQKLKAAYFLIGNMQDKYGVYYPDSAYFFDVLPVVDSLRAGGASSDKIDAYIKGEWSHISQKPKQEPQLVKDIHIITAEYLIDNIDLAFQVWTEQTWASHLSFDEFCEWILPYRVNNEPLQNWRRFMFEELQWIKDSISAPNNGEEACMRLNDYFAEDFQFSHTLGFVPMLGGIDCWNNRQGLCEHRYQLITMAARSIGLPVTIDFTPQYPHSSGGHSWTVLSTQDGIKAFNGGEKDIEYFFPARCPIGKKEITYVTTVFRYQFAKHGDAVELNENDKAIPPLFRNIYIRNVSNEYTGVNQSNLEFKLSEQIASDKPVYLYVFTSGLNLTPVDYGFAKKDEVVFNHIGRNGYYLPGVIENGQIKLLAQPLYLNYDEETPEEYRPLLNNTESVKLYRKYDLKYTMRQFMRNMQGAKIQGSNSKDFADAETLFKIDTMVAFYDEFELSQQAPYRYYRYLASDSGAIRLAELAFVVNTDAGKQNLPGKVFAYKADQNSDDDFKVENAFDNDIRTNFNAPEKSWIAMDAGKKVELNSFKILPRNNFNIVEPGDTYELVYFDNGWRPLEAKVASDYFIEFDNVPKNAILLLRNKTKGREERIFRYENGHQVWR